MSKSPPRNALTAVLLMGAIAAAVSVAAAGVGPGTPSSKGPPAMKEFAFLFRPSRAVPAIDLPKRNAAARAWALTRKAEGTLHQASPLEDEGRVVTQTAEHPAPAEHGVAAVLVLAATDLDAAVALAKTHPGLAFGTEIEIRPVKAVVPPPER